MTHRKWPIALGLVTLTAVISTLMLRSTHAVAQNSADCQILWETDAKFEALASRTSTFVAKGYVVSGFAAQGPYLYTLMCRK